MEDIVRERVALEELLAEIPPEHKLEDVVDGLSVKDLLAHRTEWGRMLLRWYAEARAGGTPAVPSPDHGWNQLPLLNAQIHARFRDVPLDRVETEFRAVHDELLRTVEAMTDEELFGRGTYAFTRSTDLAAYVNSATAAHDRSARRHIRRWWRAQAREVLV